MSKELIERLRAFAPYASPNAADLMHEAADALEAKAAPVGDDRGHDTKGSRKALGAMNAKLKAKIGRLERELAAYQRGQQPQSAEAIVDIRHTEPFESARVADYNAGWNDRHMASIAQLSDEQIFDIAEPFGEFRYGDAQGDKRIAFARAIIAALTYTPQPSAGVVAPSSDRLYEIASAIYGENLPRKEAVKLANLVGSIVNEFARLNGKGVGRG